jgi:hypothetical protein
MYNFMKSAIEEKIKTATKSNQNYASIKKTGDTAVDDAVFKSIEEWGYKVAQNKAYIMVYL